jgi:hypothetical protein
MATAHVVKLQIGPGSKLHELDSYRAQLVQRAADIDTWTATASLDALLSQGPAYEAAKAAIYAEIQTIDQWRVPRLAGIRAHPEPRRQKGRPPTAAPLRKPWRVDLSSATEPDITVIADFLTGAREVATTVCASPDQPAAFTLGRSVEIDHALGLLRGLAAQSQERERQLEARVAALEGRLADALQGAPPMKYAGVHQRALGYAAGSVVTHKGSAWVAIRAVTEGETPSESDAWQLAVQRGRDGKDAPAPTQPAGEEPRPKRTSKALPTVRLFTKDKEPRP